MTNSPLESRSAIVPIDAPPDRDGSLAHRFGGAVESIVAIVSIALVGAVAAAISAVPN